MLPLPPWHIQHANYITILPHPRVLHPYTHTPEQLWTRPQKVQCVQLTNELCTVLHCTTLHPCYSDFTPGYYTPVPQYKTIVEQNTKYAVSAAYTLVPPCPPSEIALCRWQVCVVWSVQGNRLTIFLMGLNCPHSLFQQEGCPQCQFLRLSVP